MKRRQEKKGIPWGQADSFSFNIFERSIKWIGKHFSQMLLIR